MAKILDEQLLKLQEIRFDTTYSRPKNDLGVYPINSDSPGLALVINNVNFRFMDDRQGSDVDAHNLKLLLRAYNFDIFEDGRTRNMTTDRMMDVITRFSQLADHKKYSCCILFVLTHGKYGCLYGTNSSGKRAVNVQRMLKLFQGHNCPVWRGKPKLFFLQACRVSTKDESTQLSGHDADSTDEEEIILGTIKSRDELFYDYLLSQDYDDFDTVTEIIRASHSDTFVAYSTVPGYTSWRNGLSGSWFIQAIVQVFPQYSNSQDLLSMMTEVNRLVQEKLETTSGEYKKIASPVSQLTQKFYFPCVTSTVELQPADVKPKIRNQKLTRPQSLLATKTSRTKFLDYANGWWRKKQPYSKEKDNSSPTPEEPTENGERLERLQQTTHILALGWDCFLLRLKEKKWQLWQGRKDLDFGFGAISYKSKVFVIGGQKALKPSAEVDIFCIRENKWTAGPNLNIARFNMATSFVELQRTIYVCGGCVSVYDHNILKSVEKLELDEKGIPVGGWKESAPMQQNRLGCAAVAVDRRIFVTGGRIENGESLSSVEIYDSVTEKWSYGSPMNYCRHFHAVEHCQGIIYVMGGIIGDNNETPPCEKLDLSSSTWTTIVSMRVPRYQFGSVVANGKIYIVEGRTLGETEKERSVEIYDPLTNLWLEGPRLPESLGWTCCVSWND